MSKQKSVIELEDSTILVDSEIGNLYSKFSKLCDVNYLIEDDILLFFRYFSLQYIQNSKFISFENYISKSNWTRLCSNSFFETAKFFNLKCEFETENRHDAILRDADNKIRIISEWENDKKSIFNVNGEIEKLYKSQRINDESISLLLVYEFIDDFELFVENVYKKWQDLLNNEEFYSLYLLTALKTKNLENNIAEVYAMRIIRIDNKFIEFYDDYEF